MYKIQALLEAGRIDEAQELAALGSERTWRGGPPLGRTWFLLGLGRAALLAGRPRTAEKWLAEGVLMSMGTAFYGPHRVQLSLLAVAQSWLGDLVGATTTIVELDATPRSAFSEAEDDVGRAWTAVAAGHPLEAKEVLAKAATRAEAGGQRVVEARLLHDLLRIGDVARAAPRLGALASVCEGPLIAAFAQHAQAVADGDGAALDAVSGRFETLGLMLVAAEASNAAGDAHRRAQDQRAANSSLAASKSLAMRCEGASTPGLMSTTSLVPLTAREREIGTLAAAGVASREIAARLFLSKRTVDNHLQNIYSKLGIRSRSELGRDFTGRPSVRPRHHRLRREPIGEPPRLAQRRRPSVVQDGRQRTEQGSAGRAEHLRLHSEVVVAPAELGGRGDERVMATDRGHDERSRR